MESDQKARRLWADFFKLGSPQIRAFHMSWIAFFLCFFAWFGIAPLMAVVRDELSLTKSQIGWCLIASVAITIISRVIVGWLCDRFGPRLTYTWLLVLSSLPVMGIGLSHDFATFLIFRLLIGVIGASFVITQYHTSVMFASNCVGTANATSAGWGNLGGGVTQFAMPALFALFSTVLGFSNAASWRAAMVCAGVICLLTGVAYLLFTQDSPAGNFRELRAAGKLADGKRYSGAFWQVCRDPRVWALFAIYGACFGVELTMKNVAALYFVDYFDLTLTQAGFAAAGFGLMNFIARPLGGLVSDRFGQLTGLRGRVTWLFMVLFCEGLALMLFSQMHQLIFAAPALILLGLFVQMSNGASFAVVPFVNRQALGAVAGIVGAGGNAGAVAMGFLFKGAVEWPVAFLVLGLAVAACSGFSFLVRFSLEAEAEAEKEIRSAVPATSTAMEPAVGHP